MKSLPVALAFCAVVGISASATFAAGHGPQWGHDQHVRPGVYYKPAPHHPMLYQPVPSHPWMTRPYAGHPWVPAAGHAPHYRSRHPYHYRSYYGHRYRHHSHHFHRGGFSIHGPHGGLSIRW